MYSPEKNGVTGVYFTTFDEGLSNIGDVPEMMKHRFTDGSRMNFKVKTLIKNDTKITSWRCLNNSRISNSKGLQGKSLTIFWAD